MGATASTHRGKSFEIPFLADIGEMRRESGKEQSQKSRWGWREFFDVQI